MEKVVKCTFPIRSVVLLMSGCQVNFSFCQHKICNTENVDDMKLGFYHPSHPAQGKDSNSNLDKFFFPGMPTKENLSPTANQNSQEYFTTQRLVLNDGALMQGQGPSRVSSAHRVLSSIAIGTTTPEIENNYLIWRRNISIPFQFPFLLLRALPPVYIPHYLYKLYMVSGHYRVFKNNY